ncbi:MAG: type II toxin-antitoxin system Phd/YefM family antitoxin [Treponema sp.]|nr:type II toxin-antitoxin system Phd/YefM family antitoxin [Treponema sp.]
MVINSESMVSITETNQNFSKVARLVDKNGVAVVLKNNTPRYLILDFLQFNNEEYASTDEAVSCAKRLIKKHLPAFQELAK